MNRRIIPVLLSFLLSGLGQIYKREYSKGGSLALLEMISILLISSGRPLMYEAGLFGLPIIWVLGMIDAADLLSFEYLSAGDRERWLVIGGSFLALVLATGLFVGTMWRFRPIPSRKTSYPVRITAPATPKTSEPSPAVKRSDGGETERRGKFIISLGAFKIEDNARRYASRLNGMGYSAELRSIGDRWMVLIGGFNTVDEAKAKAVELTRSGLDCYVAETDKPRFPVFIPGKGR